MTNGPPKSSIEVRGRGYPGNPGSMAQPSRPMCAAAIGLVLLWILPVWVMHADTGAWDMILFIAALFVAGSVIGGGLDAMHRATLAQEEGPVGELVEKLFRENHWP